MRARIANIADIARRKVVPVAFVSAKQAANVVVLLLVLTKLAPAQACRFGLGYSSNNESCADRESLALARVAAAKTICISGNGKVSWSKNNKEPTWAWPAMRAGQLTAIRDFVFRTSCENADLIVRYDYDDTVETVKINVTHGESGDTVFEESRNVADLRSDSVRMARHFQDMVSDARAAADAAKLTAQEQARREYLEAEREAAAERCEKEYNAIRQNIISYINIQRIGLPTSLLTQIEAHNKHCENRISKESVEKEQKEEADSKAAAASAEEQRNIRSARSARLERERPEALAAWKQRIVLTPFIPPTDGWANGGPLANKLYYIIPCGAEAKSSDCHFATEGNKPAIDCLGPVGKQVYWPVSNNDRVYLLRSDKPIYGQYAANIKDAGAMMCLREAGCYRVLAEVREDPTELPDKYSVPVPGSLTLHYASDDFSFDYPSNWKAEEKRSKDAALVQVDVAAPEAHLGKWLTHGVIVGHTATISSEYPKSLQGAYDDFVSKIGKTGLEVNSTTGIGEVGNNQGKFASYTSTSVLKSGESGFVVVTKDKNDGYYWLLMFYPSNDDPQLYRKIFEAMLKTFQFNR